MTLPNTPEPEKTEFLLYTSEDGNIQIETRLQEETVWLTQEQIAKLFGKAKSTINEHIKNIFEDGELVEEATIRNFRTVQLEGDRHVSRVTEHYNLELIITVGYRVRSQRGTQFRQWATQRLKEYIIKGFAMDDERLKKAGGGNYFDELLARIRDIRSSEKVFWRKVLDIYATSIDYNPTAETSQTFFKVIQNKMHWAAHGHTAAEIIYERADSSKPNMGLTNWLGEKIRKQETEIAKNYLTEEELDVLNRIVTLYLDFAELQALNRQPMTMEDWITKLDDFLKFSGRELLLNAGSINNHDALEKAHIEYEKYKKDQLSELSPVERHFLEASKKLEAQNRKTSQRGGKSDD